jgi:hypothetical protein
MFRFLASSTLALALGLVTLAAPLTERAKLTNFYLVTTPTKPGAGKPVNATGLNLFDPYYQPHYLLRAQENAGSYVPFNLTKYVPFQNPFPCPTAPTTSDFQLL